MKTNFVKVVAFLFAIGLVFSFSACFSDPGQISPATNASVSKTDDCAGLPCSSENVSPVDKKINQTVCQNPVIVGAAFDKTGSMKWSGTAATTAEDLTLLLQHIAICGGSTGVTFIKNDSAKPIERFRANEPPPILVKPTPFPKEEDYEFADRIDEYDQKVLERDKVVRQNLKDIQPKIDDYLNTLAPLLAQKPKGSTDFSSAVNRLLVFLEEGDATWQIKPHRYLIISSDAEDTAGKTRNSFKADATVFWVNATASDKAMKDFPYQRFESFQAAVAEVLAREGVK